MLIFMNTAVNILTHRDLTLCVYDIFTSVITITYQCYPLVTYEHVIELTLCDIYLMLTLTDEQTRD